MGSFISSTATRVLNWILNTWKRCFLIYTSYGAGNATLRRLSREGRCCTHMMAKASTGNIYRYTIKPLLSAVFYYDAFLKWENDEVIYPIVRNRSTCLLK